MSQGEMESHCRKLQELIAQRGKQPDTHLDAIIQSEVWLALWEADDIKALDIDQIEVIVSQCEVWLKGQVEDEQQQQLAECLVRAVDGVFSCHNELSTEDNRVR